MIQEESFYSGSPRGAQWHKWDLHVHTPASIVQEYGRSDDTWEKYLCALEALPSEIKVLGINDYFTLDGYRRIRSEKQQDRLANIELLLPVVEFRLKQLAGHKKLQKINYHIVFSDQLTADQIEARFLNKLEITYKLEDGEEHTVVGCHRESLIDLGNAILASTPEGKRPNSSALEMGFANAVFSLEDIQRFVVKQFLKISTLQLWA